jgi:hypothetical protein
MSREAAMRAACDALLRKEILMPSYEMSLRNGKCAVDKTLRDPSMAVYSGWSVKADGFWCMPFGAAQDIDFEFNERDGRLVRIAAYCPPFDP